ncbi:AraC family transcriptional regulator [Halosquirtibacter xylanolyticus]|uniref:helix-turn-helix domain-containing protein n=1 Tax=Halosquirtibacter xylanolyticus TaxID=3374599 RepID=UPI0037499F3A|nr:AraC family transcriptional regulator [Prolixibacteraceae bacterium]
MQYIYDDIQEYTQAFASRTMVNNHKFCLCSIKEYPSDNKQYYKRYKVPHYRTFFEIAIIENDSMQVQIGDTISYSSSSVIEVISPYQLFSMKPPVNLDLKNNNASSRIYTILFSASFLGKQIEDYEIQNQYPYFKLHTLPRYSLTKDELQSFKYLIRSMKEEPVIETKEYSKLLKSYLKLILLKISLITKNGDTKAIISRSEQITSQFESLLSKHTSPFLSIPEYASLMNISPAYLTESIKRATGKSAQTLLIDYKLLFAKSLIKQGKTSITEIADKIGFSDNSNFVKFFKRHTGTTPRRFRDL